VFLLNVDNSGKPIGAPLAVSSTDADGFFLFNVPSGTNLSPTASTLTIIQAAVSGASNPVPIGGLGVLNVPAVQQLMLVDPAGELGTRRIITAGVGKFSASAAAGYVGLIQALLDQVPSLVGGNIATTIINIQNHFSFQSEVLPILVDIEQSAQVDQSVVAGGYNIFAYHTYADSSTTPYHRTVENGNLTFDPVKGTVVVNTHEFGGTLKETCTTICTRTFMLQSFVDQTLDGEGIFFRTAKNRLIFSAPGSLSFAAHANPTGTVAIYGVKSSDGEQSLGIAIKKGTGISGADFTATFNYVNVGSFLNDLIVSGNAWIGILQSRTGTGTLTLGGSNNSVNFMGSTGTIDSASRQFIVCNPSGGGCVLSATLSPQFSQPIFGAPFFVSDDGSIFGGRVGSGGMSADGALYAMTTLTPGSPIDISLSVVVKQPNGMTPANLTGTYRVITLEDDLLTTAQVTTRLLTGTAQFDGGSSSTFTTLTGQVDRTEGCLAGVCNINTTINTAASPPVSETRTYGVTTTGILTFTGGSIPGGATVSGGISPDASFFVIQTQADDVGGTSTRSITLGVKTP
jgi:hypothetical protein